MLGWLKRRGWPAQDEPKAREQAPPPPRRRMSGKYQLLYAYLDDRFANTVVLTFAEIEDLLGFILPDEARRQPEWWTNPATGAPPLNHSDSWTLANRTARPNLLAQTVAFERPA
jgi:hypothetical protein